jgi:Family of unknown function (DUF6467)
VGSLTGAVSSKRVTEEFKGTLSPVGNRASSVKVEGCLTARPMSRAGSKDGLSDPAVLDGKAVAQQIKGTPGITGLSPLSVHSGEEVWHLNTSGCSGSDSLPTNRLITVNPSADLWACNASSLPGDTVGSSVDQTDPNPVTTDPKGEASGSGLGQHADSCHSNGEAMRLQR